MRRRVAVGLLLVMLGIAKNGASGGVDPEALTRHGLALRREGRDAEALEEFRHAYAVRPTPSALAQIALAEQALGLWVVAEADLQSALDEEDPWIARHRRLLASGLADIRTHLAGLEVECEVIGAELWVNGARSALLPLARPLRVEAGSVVIELRAPGYAPARRLTSVAGGENARETIRLVPLAPSPAAPPEAAGAPPPPAPVLGVSALSPLSRPLVRPVERAVATSRPMRAASFVVFGTAAMALGAGAYLGARTLAAKAQRDDHCRPGCDAAGVAYDAEARSFADRSTVWFLLGAAAGGVGAVLLWQSRGLAASGGGPVLRVGIDPGQHGGGAELEGTF